MNPGDFVARYVIERVLGQGAMGTVYQAYDPMIGRKVALKTLRTDISSDYSAEFKERFLREARAAGRLSHPNIITVFDIGDDAAHSIVFIAMEFIEGSTLEDLVSPDRLIDIDRIVDLGATLAETLDYAHSEGVVHRDIKPANVLLTESGRPMISDFGIARLEASQLTVEGARLGTPYYMSPEQVKGETVDGRTDLYALGVILFKLLTGLYPFSGDSFFAMMNAILTKEAPDLEPLHPGLPKALSAAVRKVLAKNRDQRFQSGAEFAAALRGSIQPGMAPRMAHEEQDFSQATMIGASLGDLKKLKGTIEFLSGNRHIHLCSALEILIGREATCEICLTETSISRKHAIINFTNRNIRFTDLSSSNGSTHNADRISQPVYLNDGDVIGIGGSVHFLVRVKGNPEKPRSLSLITGNEEYVISQGEVFIGSDPVRADIRIPDRSVQALHARIVPGFGIPSIRSEGAHAPVFIDGRQEEVAPLTDQCTVTLGQTRFVWLATVGGRPVPGPTRF